MNLEEAVSTIVRQVVEELLRSKGRIPAPTDRAKVLVLLADGYDAARIEPFIRHIAAFSEPVIGLCGDQPLQPFPGDIGCATIRLSNGDRPGWKAAADEASVVAAPQLTLGTLVRISQLIDDDAFAGTMVYAIVSGKDAVLSTSHLLPSGADRLKVPPHVVEKVASHWQQLAKYGVHAEALHQLHRLVKTLIAAPRAGRRPLVHARHVREWAKEGESQIALPASALITSLAREEAGMLGLRLEHGENERKEG
ncbi:hypothetical protein PAE9249_04849 [Paenibacillus sp. CECT 9249]|uniref:hypothetical protein n=1 Tax=Paenibacillus sp. CECT 9249 TaxID=2845385 RepID=UPI001E5C5EDE|nr:hypothetical protein [Paenibacillus sp. CECT 9249]CAH0122301.1 hypothetical protein PAE9249_04849 [Paenibacillus sp. CECT 9249]